MERSAAEMMFSKDAPAPPEESAAEIPEEVKATAEQPAEESSQ
jgi:hypothetical protein